MVEVGELLGACDWCGGGGVRAQVLLEVAFMHSDAVAVLCNY